MTKVIVIKEKLGKRYCQRISASACPGALMKAKISVVM